MGNPDDGTFEEFALFAHQNPRLGFPFGYLADENL